MECGKVKSAVSLHFKPCENIHFLQHSSICTLITNSEQSPNEFVIKGYIYIYKMKVSNHTTPNYIQGYLLIEYTHIEIRLSCISQRHQIAKGC